MVEVVLEKKEVSVFVCPSTQKCSNGYRGQAADQPIIIHPSLPLFCLSAAADQKTNARAHHNVRVVLTSLQSVAAV